MRFSKKKNKRKSELRRLVLQKRKLVFEKLSARQLLAADLNNSFAIAEADLIPDSVAIASLLTAEAEATPDSNGWDLPPTDDPPLAPDDPPVDPDDPPLDPDDPPVAPDDPPLDPDDPPVDPDDPPVDPDDPPVDPDDPPVDPDDPPVDPDDPPVDPDDPPVDPDDPPEDPDDPNPDDPNPDDPNPDDPNPDDPNPDDPNPDDPNPDDPNPDDPNPDDPNPDDPNPDDPNPDDPNPDDPNPDDPNPDDPNPDDPNPDDPNPDDPNPDDPGGGGGGGGGAPDPTPRIAAVEFFDSELKQSIDKVDEGDGFYSVVFLSGILKSEYVLHAWADINFDGSVQPEERQDIPVVEEQHRYDIFWDVEDDGPWPGNDTSQDDLDVQFVFLGERTNEQLSVENVEPRIIPHPILGFGTNANGEQGAILNIGVLDAGKHDEHDAVVIWGDGTMSTSSQVDSNSACDGHHSQFRIFRVIDPSDVLFPISIEITDDDTGKATYYFDEADVSYNNDDDDESFIDDLYEYEVNGDDDLLGIDLSKLISDEMGKDEGSWIFRYDSSHIRVWASAAKKTLILPYGGSPPDGLEDFKQYEGEESVYVEGVKIGEASLSLGWQLGVPDNSDGPTEPGVPPTGVGSCNTSIIYGGSIEIMVWGVDIDIDSDNNGVLERSEWEEELDEHPFALGKLRVAYSDSRRERIIVELPKGLDSTKYWLKISGETIEGGSSGMVTLDDANFQNLGSTSFNNHVATVRLDELRYYDVDGLLYLYLRDTPALDGPQTKLQVDQVGKPDNRITVELIGAPLETKDSVKVMVVDNMNRKVGGKPVAAFYAHLNQKREIRSAGAADAVYHFADAKNFTMRYIDQEEVEELLEDSDLQKHEKATITSYLFDWLPSDIITPKKPRGFQAGLYRDYVSGKYVLAFRGSETSKWSDIEDWISNARQGLTGDDPAYDAAIVLGDLLPRVHHIQDKGLNFTGHSLGGGLASASAIVNTIEADVFNGAGVHENTIRRRDGKLIKPGTSLEDGRDLIKHYYVAARFDDAKYHGEGAIDQPDILTFFSKNVSILPNPAGTEHLLEGLDNVNDIEEFPDGILLLHEFDENFTAIQYADWLIKVAYTFKLEFFEMGDSHRFPSIYFGLLHNRESGWNAFDSTNALKR